MNHIRYDEKVAIITGGARGLGKEYAKLLASRGAIVVINDNAVNETGEPLAFMTAKLINEKGGKAIANLGDITKKDEIWQLTSQVMEAYGRIDILVHNAGIAVDTPLIDMTEGEWFETIDVHLNGAFFLLKEILPIMLKVNYGRIVMVASSVGMYGTRNHCAYGAAKMGVYGLVQSLKHELQDTNVYCNLISPLAATEQTNRALNESLRSMLKPEYVAPLVAYLCSSECRQFAETIVAGGGYLSANTFYEGKGIGLLANAITIEQIRDRIDEITDLSESRKMSTTNDAAKKIFRTVQKINRTKE